MNKIIFLTFLFITITSRSQSVEYTLGNNNTNMQDNFYLKDNNNLLDKFVGTWKFEQNGKSLEITLQKVIKMQMLGYFQDELQGTFIYKENNIEIVNTQGQIGDNACISGRMISNNTPNKIKLNFDDPGRPKVSCVIYLNYTSYINNIKKLDWKLVGVALLPFEENEVAPTDIRIIKECVLTKL